MGRNRVDDNRDSPSPEAWRRPRTPVRITREHDGTHTFWVARDAYGIVALSEQREAVEEHLARHGHGPFDVTG